MSRVLCLPLAAMICGFVSPMHGDEAESWMKVEIGGQPVGYEYSKQTVDGDEVTTESTTLVRISRFGQSFEIKTVLTVVEESEQLKSFRLEQISPGQPVQVSRGVVDGATMQVTTTSNGRESSRELKIPDGLLSPTAADRVIEESPPPVGESVSLKVFSVETLAPVVMTLTNLGKTATTWSDGKTRKAETLKLKRSDLALEPTFYLDKDGELAKVEFGLMEMVGWATDRESALAAAEGKNEIDLGERTVLKISPQPGLSNRDSAVYHVSGTELPKLAGSQSVTKAGNALVVEVVTPDVGTAKRAGDVDSEYTASTRWIDWDTKLIKKLASRLSSDAKAGKVAAEAEALVGRYVSNKSFGVGFATASEVAATREGDCTEHGVLLAAVLRAAGLPSRVCYGLVYVESMAAMVPHMWTEVALDDQWFPLDATRPGAPNGGYLKFGDSSLSSDSSLPIRDLLNLSKDLEQMTVHVTADEPAGGKR